jgi:hypothetical protein
MIKKILFTFLFLSSLCIFSQEIVKEFDIKLERKRNFFQVVNKEKNEVVLFSNDKEKVTSVRFDDKFGIKDSLSAARPEKTYTEILGYSQKENNYFMFWGSKDRKKISSQFFDFAKKETGTKTFELELKKEKIIKEITINNVFYLITITKKTGDLKFYIFDNSDNLTTKTVDLSNISFKNSLGNPVNLYTVLTEDSFGFFIQNIGNDSPPSLALSSKKFKIYTYKNSEITLTLDNNINSTEILRINLTDFSANLKSIDQPVITRGEFDFITFKTNSFLIDDKILQIKTNPEVLFLTITDLNGNRINQFKTLREEEISFKNSDVFQETGSFHNKKLLEKPKQFIRKINNSTPSISCYNLNGLYYTVIGSSKDIVHSGGMAPGFGGGFGGGGFVGSPVSFGFSSTYTIENLISYKDKIVVYTNCLFDSNFNHIPGEIKTSAFDKARIFLEENEEITDGSTLFNKSIYDDLIIFKFKTSLYLGNYNKEQKKYKIFSFSE